MRHQQYRGPTLPKNLLSQLGDTGRSGRKGQNRTEAIGRKARRKAERQAKKNDRRAGRRGAAFSSSREEEEESEVDDFEEFEDEEPAPAPRKRSTSPKAPAKPPKSILKKAKLTDAAVELDDDSVGAAPIVSRSVRTKLDEDDAEIAALEKKLGIKSTKNSKSFQDDGLDFLLEDLEDEDIDLPDNGKKRKSAEDDEWLANKRRKATKDRAATRDESSSKQESEIQEDDFLSDEDLDELSGDDEDLLEDLEESGDDYDQDEGTDEDNEEDVDSVDDFESDEESAPKEKVKENPYRPPVAAGTSAGAKYIPPSLRGPPSSDAEALNRLRRQLQGLLNRLSEANLLSILKEVEQIYQSNPRQYVTSTLIDLLLGLVCDRTALTDTFLILHAGFIAAVHKILGSDFGAQLIEKIVSEFDRFYDSFRQNGSTEKQPANLLSLLAELYNFQVIGCNLIFDYIKLFLAELSDLNAELLLKLVKLSGPQLRQDDPSALKDIVVLQQETVRKTGEANMSVRAKFMVETINNLKNNRMKTGVAASALVSEHTTRMKKTLGSLNSRNIKASEPLRIGLSDFQNSEKRGKWWLVGASWKEETLSKGKDEQAQSNGLQEEEVDDDEDNFGQGTTDLLRLAKEQGMNTDIRRAIFITIMSATDYKDAHIRLLALRLKKSQEGEIPRVLIQCAGSEKSYNPYYTLISRRLCGDRKTKTAFQFCLWDLFKRMGERGPDDEDAFDPEDETEKIDTRKIVNLARMFAGLLAENSLPITCLKVLGFTYLQQKTGIFLEVLLTSIILQTQRKSPGGGDEKSLMKVFSHIAEAPQMVIGLQYFLKKVVSKADIASNKAERDAVRWACATLDKAMTEMELPVDAA